MTCSGFPDWLLPTSFSMFLSGMLTLFMAITGGVSYDDAMRPLRDVSHLALALVSVYISIGVIVVLNAP